ncbi:unnamed protein product [Ectocarpus sp. 12 AP-2014]
MYGTSSRLPAARGSRVGPHPPGHNCSNTTSLLASSRSWKRMSTATPAFYILNKTGVFFIANGFHIRDNLKAHGCFFRPAGAPPTIPVKSWVGVAADDDAARMS